MALNAEKRRTLTYRLFHCRRAFMIGYDGGVLATAKTTTSEAPD
jgi:hypothetical protein